MDQTPVSRDQTRIWADSLLRYPVKYRLTEFYSLFRQNMPILRSALPGKSVLRNVFWKTQVLPAVLPGDSPSPWGHGLRTHARGRLSRGGLWRLQGSLSRGRRYGGPCRGVPGKAVRVPILSLAFRSLSCKVKGLDPSESTSPRGPRSRMTNP